MMVPSMVVTTARPLGQLRLSSACTDGVNRMARKAAMSTGTKTDAPARIPAEIMTRPARATTTVTGDLSDFVSFTLILFRVRVGVRWRCRGGRLGT